MKRLLFHGEHKFRAAELFFHDKPRFRVEDYIPYIALEVVWQDDGRFSIWGDLDDDAVLLQDTSHDPRHLVEHALPLADGVEEDAD
ncbi:MULTISPECIES: hypothetical protein [Caproicibacterium]|uniref:Uncharacterized protein n=1 Tax=Caproicibacterium argilliputei TaxID=3030016 RepID=A0AA97D771_9FIRM|nr:hypothetical protein [Caproicibacterium argilliputei]WOC31594.1 hypothetical protein PXC00_10280 [Caproicibacterium argilliputei]